MNDKLIYKELNTNLISVSKNIDLILSNMDKIDEICLSALVLDDQTSYKNDIIKLKSILENQKQKINKEIIIEIKQNI